MLNPFRKTPAVASGILQMSPQILQAVIQTESAAHGLPGETKTQIVVNTVRAAAQAARGVPVPQVQEISEMAALFVGVLNATGVFNHGKAPALVAA